MARKYFFMGNPKARGVDPDNDTNTVVDGVAKSGKVSDQGTVAHTEHWSGQVDANVTPNPVSMKIKTQRNG